MHGGLAAGGWLVPKAGRGGRGEARGGEVVRQIGLQAWVVWQTWARLPRAYGVASQLERRRGWKRRLELFNGCS